MLRSKALEKKTTNSRAICNSVLFKSYKAGGFGFLPFLFARNEEKNSTDDKRKKQDVAFLPSRNCVAPLQVMAG